MSRYFTKDHEWIEVEGETGTVGITDYAQGQLGDITFVELPEVGRTVAAAESVADAARRDRSLGVRIEARYTVGEYDILILSAKQSTGLAIWLAENGYNVPPRAARVLSGYLKQGMKFFVARVNLKEQARLGFTYLRPIQMAFESPKFGLPLRLGMANADGAQKIVDAVTKGSANEAPTTSGRRPEGQMK